MTQFISAHAARLGAHLRPVACLDSNAGSSQFETWAIDLFASQFEHNTAYRKLCLGQGRTPKTVTRWAEIPAVPTTAFKEMEMTCLPPDARTAVFHSSGTTEQRPSRHFHNPESLALYEASLRNSFAAHMLFERKEKICFGLLTPPQEQAPHSSLAHMFAVVRETFGTDDSFFAGTVSARGQWEVNCELLLPALREFEQTDRPIALLGTAFNFVHLLQELRSRGLRFRLAPSSRVMETGGYKGRSRALAKSELYGLIDELLGVPQSHIVSEYGMSELSSQAYDLSLAPPGETEQVSRDAITGPLRSKDSTKRPAFDDVSPTSRLFRFPPWARFLVISPETGRPVPDGEPGLLRIFDLANVASALAVQTGDLAVRRGDGFELLGRAALAEPRGCSLMSV